MTIRALSSPSSRAVKHIGCLGCRIKGNQSASLPGNNRKLTSRCGHGVAYSTTLDQDVPDPVRIDDEGIDHSHLLHRRRSVVFGERGDEEVIFTRIRRRTESEASQPL